MWFSSFIWKWLWWTTQYNSPFCKLALWYVFGWHSHYNSWKPSFVKTLYNNNRNNKTCANSNDIVTRHARRLSRNVDLPVSSQIGPKSKRPQNESQIGHIFQIELKKNALIIIFPRQPEEHFPGLKNVKTGQQ